MQHDKIPDELRTLAFEFFYWFSRFEFALKECGYLKDRTVGAKAERIGRPLLTTTTSRHLQRKP